MPDNYFTKLSSVDVSKHTEKKGRFTYLSWPFAIETLCKSHPDATWEVVKNNGVPYIETKFGVFVEVSVTVDGVTRSQIHPVLDNRNNPIKEPTSFQINTSIQRALVKAIALHGLGLYIYAGEDLPTDNPKQEDLGYTQDQKKAFDSLVDANDSLGLALFSDYVGPEVYSNLYNSGEKDKKCALKDKCREMEHQGRASYDLAVSGLKSGEDMLFLEQIEDCLPITITLFRKTLSEPELSIFNELVKNV